MSDYLFIVNVGDNIVSSVHISKFVPNRRAKSSEYINFKVGVYIQTKNNVNWMNLLRLTFENSPKRAAKIMSKIYVDDSNIGKLVKKLTK